MIEEMTFNPGGSVLARNDQLGSGDLYARFEDKGHLITFTREEVMLPDGVPVLVVLHTDVVTEWRVWRRRARQLRARRVH